MKKNLSVILFTVIFTTSCSNTNTNVMPENNYKLLGTMSGSLRKCFEIKKISPKIYADTIKSLSYTLSSWTYDPKKFSSMEAQAYSLTAAKNCRQVEAAAHMINSNVVEKKQNQKDRANALRYDRKEGNENKMIYCNKIGSTTICN